MSVVNGTAPDVGLGDLGHVDGRLDTGGLPQLLEGVLKGQGVDRGGEHAHVVGLGPVHPCAGAGHPAPDVAAADHHGYVDLKLGAYVGDIAGYATDDVTVDSVAGLSGEGLSGDLQDDTVPACRDPVASGHLRPPGTPG